MKRYSRLYFLACVTLCSLFLVTACDNELETDGLAPFFRLEFINQTVIDSLGPLVDNLDTEITTITDSLSFLDSLTTAGDPRDFTNNIEILSATQTLLSSDRTEAEGLLDDANNGLVLINSVATFGGDGVLLFEDSLSNYALPLNPNTNSSLYRISLGGTIYNLETEYERNTVVKERSVFIEAVNFNVIEEGTSFDSLIIVFGDTINYTSNETTVTLFF